jgi:hypothetical protein
MARKIASCPNFPVGYPNSSMPDPLAIQIGSTLPFAGPTINMGYNAPDQMHFWMLLIKLQILHPILIMVQS